jgi:L-seryl-tRNA(Ser) seleniumtransferase
LVADLVRRELAKIRRRREIPEPGAIVGLVRTEIEKLCESRVRPVINATGIVVHTNLGRSPLPQGAGEVLQNVSSAYNNIELALAAGDRGHRGAYVERALAVLCQAEAATVVNNCAAALVLIVRYFTRDKNEVVISRGELVQIGGGFRIGEILEASGAKLREVGATNKTTLDDYALAIAKQTALILKVHRSNFFMSGFVGSPRTGELASLARKKRIPFVEDLGSGAMIATEQIGLQHHEQTPAESLKSGADLVCFSGDKLFGGPQAGIIVGKKRLIDALKREPLFRALRCDKLTFAALQTTVDLHLNQVTSEIPALALLQTPTDELRARATAIVTRLQGLPLKIRIGSGTGRAGGGTLPKSFVPSITVDLLPRNCSLEEFAQALRQSTPPIVAYIGNGRIKLDLRTVFSHQDDLLVDAIRTASTSR